jgi:hypothetical protein
MIIISWLKQSGLVHTSYNNYEVRQHIKKY